MRLERCLRLPPEPWPWSPLSSRLMRVVGEFGVVVAVSKGWVWGAVDPKLHAGGSPADCQSRPRHPRLQGRHLWTSMQFTTSGHLATRQYSKLRFLHQLGPGENTMKSRITVHNKWAVWVRDKSLLLPTVIWGPSVTTLSTSLSWHTHLNYLHGPSRQRRPWPILFLSVLL